VAEIYHSVGYFAQADPRNSKSGLPDGLSEQRGRSPSEADAVLAKDRRSSHAGSLSEDGGTDGRRLATACLGQPPTTLLAWCLSQEHAESPCESDPFLAKDSPMV